MTISKAKLTTVTNVSYERSKASPQLEKCPKCQKGFKPGFVIVSKKSTKTRWYHKKCAEALNIWSDEE